jgi:hypothetical protein
MATIATRYFAQCAGNDSLRSRATRRWFTEDRKNLNKRGFLRRFLEKGGVYRKG